MRQYVCDRCKRVIVGGMNDRPYVWHRTIHAEEHDAHFDLCETCDGMVLHIIHHPEVIGHLS